MGSLLELHPSGRMGITCELVASVSVAATPSVRHCAVLITIELNIWVLPCVPCAANESLARHAGHAGVQMHTEGARIDESGRGG